MRIIGRYVLTEFLKVFGGSIAAFVLIYLVVDFLEKIDNFIEAGVGFASVGAFFLYSIPYIVFNVAPVAVLVAVLICLGLMAQHLEVVAVKTLGVSPVRLAAPILMLSLLISLGMLGLAESVIPRSSSLANDIWKYEVQKRQDAASGRFENIWIRQDNAIFHLGLLDQQAKRISGLSVFRFGEGFRLDERLEARRAQKDNGGWEARDGFHKTYLEDGALKLEDFTSRKVFLPDLDRDFAKVNRPPEEMTLNQLYFYAQQVQRDGHDPTRYWVDFHMKISYPFICFIMAAIGLPLALRREKGGGIALGIGLGVGLSFLYLVTLGVAKSLGYSGFLPPLLAAWTPNIIFSLGSIFFFAFVRQ